MLDMKKNTWIQPVFEVETFVPNNYIALCSLTIEPLNNLTGYVIVDTDNNGKMEGVFSFDTTDPTKGVLSGSNDNEFLFNNPFQQVLSSPSTEIVAKQGTFTAVNNAVFFTQDGQHFESYTAVTLDVENERNMVFYTKNVNKNNS